MTNTDPPRPDTMPIRDLTPTEADRLLSQAEVNALPEGTDVLIKWHGGNGPHPYEIDCIEGVAHPFVGKTPLTMVTTDPESIRTKVFLPQDD